MKINRDELENDLVIPGRTHFLDSKNSINFYPLHWHYNYEIDYVAEGGLAGKINGRDVSASEGEFLFVNSGDLHDISVIPGHDIYGISIVISYNLVKSYLPDVDNMHFEFRSNESVQKIRKLVLRCAEIYRYKDEFYELELSIKMRQICRVLFNECLVREPSISENSKGVANVKKAITYMEDNYNKPITLDDIASEVGLAPTYFSRFFKKLSGDTFYSYLRSIRLSMLINNWCQLIIQSQILPGPMALRMLRLLLCHLAKYMAQPQHVTEKII